jgi:hypothetical protein
MTSVRTHTGASLPTSPPISLPPPPFPRWYTGWPINKMRTSPVPGIVVYGLRERERERVFK